MAREREALEGDGLEEVSLERVTWWWEEKKSHFNFALLIADQPDRWLCGTANYFFGNLSAVSLEFSVPRILAKVFPNLKYWNETGETPTTSIVTAKTGRPTTRDMILWHQGKLGMSRPSPKGL
ncbi:hypothetical protein B0H10DRAFT_1962240 [Mycena sp. CBHHK59/15]|nr:hypothetical protein B0H10DRAFT_1962240 [Mycena sp. CBHHK59/15]